MIRHLCILVVLTAVACGKDKSREEPAPSRQARTHREPREIIQLPREVVRDVINGHPVEVKIPTGMRRDALQGELLFSLDDFTVNLELHEYTQPDGAPALDEALVDSVVKGMMSPKLEATTRRVLPDAVHVTWQDKEHRALGVTVIRKARSDTRSWWVRCHASWDARDPIAAFEHVRTWTEQLCLSLTL